MNVMLQDLPTAWASNYGRDEVSDEQGYDDDGDLFQMCGVIILVVCASSSAELFNMNNEVYRVCSTGLLGDCSRNAVLYIGAAHW
jgi:hypothetical protein